MGLYRDHHQNPVETHDMTWFTAENSNEQWFETFAKRLYLNVAGMRTSDWYLPGRSLYETFDEFLKTRMKRPVMLSETDKEIIFKRFTDEIPEEMTLVEFVNKYSKWEPKLT